MENKLTQPIQRTKIFSTEYTGYIDEIPQKVKDKMKSEKPELHKQLFEKE